MITNAIIAVVFFQILLVKKEVIKLLMEGDESLTSDNSLQTESNSGLKSKTTANLLDTPTAEKATASAKHPFKVLTNSTFEDQENISLSIVKGRRKLSMKRTKNDKSSNKGKSS